MTKQVKIIFGFIVLLILLIFSLWFNFSLKSELKSQKKLNNIATEFYKEQINLSKEKNKNDSIFLENKNDSIILRLKYISYLRYNNLAELKNELEKINSYKTDSTYKSINDSIFKITM